MKRLVILMAIALVPLKSVYAEAVDFSVGSDMAELSYLTQNASFGDSGADIGFSVLVNEYNDVVASGLILVSGNKLGDVDGLHLGVGAKVYIGFLDEPNGLAPVDGGAIAIGARVRYLFPGSTPVAIFGEGYFAPAVTSLSGIDGIVETRLGFELEVTPSARAFVGYRNIEVTFDNNVDYEVDEGAHVGLRFEF